jgi:cobalt-zinc-cadmium efflux system outer membrane protein
MKRCFFLTWLVVLALIPSAGSSQQPDDTNDLQTLPDYLRYASLNNAELKANFEQWKAALEQVPQAKALDDPKFTYSYFIEEVETRVGPQKNRFGIMQIFPWFGKIEARTDVATAKANVARQRYEASKLRLFRQVKEAFYEFTYLATAIDIAKENLELLEHFEEIALTKYRTALTTHPDIIRAQVELARLEDVLKSLEKLREPTVASLNSVLNRPAGTELTWPKKEAPREVTLNRQYIIEALIRANPELAELNWEVEAAKAEVELAKKKFYPDIGVGIDWIQTDSAISPGVRDSGKDPVVLMFSMNIPQAIKVLYDVEDSQRKMHLYGDILVSKAQELVQASESAYRAGTVDFLSLIDAQRMLLKYTLDHERAITNNQQKLSELEMLIGREL